MVRCDLKCPKTYFASTHISNVEIQAGHICLHRMSYASQLFSCPGLLKKLQIMSKWPLLAKSERAPPSLLPFAMVSVYSGHNSQTPIASLSSLLLLLLFLLWFLTIFLLSSLTPINRSYCRLKPLSIQRKVETDIRLDRRAYLLYTFCIFIFCLAGLSTDRRQPARPALYVCGHKFQPKFCKWLQKDH